MDEFTQPDAPDDFNQDGNGSRGARRKRVSTNKAARKLWNAANRSRLRGYTYAWRNRKKSAYNDYQRRYMAARRALLKARRLEEEAGYGEV